jgi:tetratricopeptide (TPR) repeat protein
MALYVDNNPDASRLFLDMVDIGELLPRVGCPALANLYRGVAFYFAIHDRRLDTALRAISIARSLAPTNQRIAATEIWLVLASGQTKRAADLLGRLGPLSDDPGLAYWLGAVYFSDMGDHSRAIALYEKALQQERDSEMQSKLHFSAAMEYAMSPGLTHKVAGDGIVSHLEDARQLSNNPVFSAILGYGWALLGNAGQCTAAFERANSLIVPSSAPADREPVLKFVAQWRAKSLLKLGQPLLAKATIENFVGDPAGSTNVSLLQDFGHTLLDVAGFSGRPEEFEAAEKYFDRIIELNPHDGKAYHYKGYALTMRAQNLTEPNGEKGRFLRDAARGEFLKAIRFGYEQADAHLVLAKLYEADGDVVNAEKHRERYCELGDGDTDCLVRRAAKLVKAGDVTGAREAFAKVRETRALPDAQVFLREGTSWQIAGNLMEAERAYTEALRVEPRLSAAHDNMAFVLFDLGRIKEALAHWERAVELNRQDPDSLAGKAIALEALGNRRAALVAYRAAVKWNKDYLDTRVLHEQFAWSNRACETATPLLDAIR